MSEMFGPPAASTGVDLNELEGALLLIKPLKVETGINTSLGAKDATVADIHVLDGDQAGDTYTEVFIWPKVLQGQLRSYVGTGRYTLGRLGKGDAKPGQNAPWKLLGYNDKDERRAAQYLAKLAPVGAPDDNDDPPF